jgi:hypothetical protein
MNPQYASRGTYHVMDDSGKLYYARNCMFNESEVQQTNLTIENLKELKLQSNELTQNNLYELDCIEIPLRINIINRISICNKISFMHVNPRDVITPLSLKEAMSGKFAKEWREATDAEYNSLVERGTWILVPRNSMPHNKKPVKNKWVYKLKLTITGQIERFKARLVAKGFTQTKNVDYFDKYAPVVDIMTFLYMFAWGIGNNMCILQIDVKTAFLYGDLDEEIYMDQPEGFIQPGDQDKVCLLKKSLYGLKQAPLCWNKKLNEHFTSTMSFNRLSTDICLYRRDGVYIVVYVDDMLVYGITQQHCDDIFNELSSAFQCSNLGFPQGMLGMIITPVEGGGAIIHQTKYINELLDRFDMKDAKPKKTPLSPSVNYYDVNDDSATIKSYQELLGCLLFASIRTRPDIAHSVALLARFTHNPKKVHYTGLKHILRYLKGTKDYGLYFKANVKDNDIRCYNSELKGFCDASFADVITDKRKSSMGYVITFNGTAISWKATKSTIVVTSTAEAEYIAMCLLTKQIMYLRNMRIELGHQKESESIQAYSDNQSALKFSKNQINKSGMKHIDLKYYFTKEAIERKLITFDYVATEEMVADIFTKVLDEQTFVRLRRMLGLVQLPSITPSE